MGTWPQSIFRKITTGQILLFILSSKNEGAYVKDG